MKNIFLLSIVISSNSYGASQDSISRFSTIVNHVTRIQDGKVIAITFPEMLKTKKNRAIAQSIVNNNGTPTTVLLPQLVFYSCAALMIIQGIQD